MKTFLLAALTLLVAAAAFAQPEQITLPENSPSQRTVQLEELWRVGGEDDEDILLGMVAIGVRDEQGNVYLLDSQLSQVLVINPDGELIDTLGREGEGPGEMSRPTGLFLNNSSQIGISQGFPGKIILLNMDGTPGGTINVNQDSESGGFAFVGTAFKRGEHLVVMHGKGTFDMETGMINTRSVLTGIDEQGKELALFAEHNQVRDMNKQVFDEAANFSELTTWALGNNSLLTVPEREKYIINIKGMDGEIKQVISRPFQPRKRNDEDKEDLTSGMEMVINGRSMEMEKHILDYDRAILTMDVATDGRIFVQNCYQAAKYWADGMARKYDIIDADGVFIEELTLEFPGFDTEQDALLFLDGEYFLYMKGFEGATQSMRSAFGGGGEKDDETEEAEPLEVIFCRISAK